MVNKCAAVACRSGYNPTMEEKRLLKCGKTAECKKHVFSFPKNAELRAKWVLAVRRQDFNPDNSGVCVLHFKPSDLLTYIPHTSTEGQRQRLRLKTNAVPSFFKKYPQTVRPKIVEERQTSRASLSGRRAYELETQKEINDSFVANDNLRDLNDLMDKLSSSILPSGFRTVMMSLPGEDKLISIRTEEVDLISSLPIITSNISVYSNLKYKMHVNGIQVSVRKVAATYSESGQFYTLNEVLNVLARLKGLVADTHDYLEAAAKMLDSKNNANMKSTRRLPFSERRLDKKKAGFKRDDIFIDESINTMDIGEESIHVMEIVVEPYDAMELKVKPVETMDMGEPVGTIGLKENPADTIGIKEEPVDTLEIEPYGIIDLKEKPVNAIDMAKEPVNTMDLNLKLVDTIGAEEEHIYTIKIEVEPFDTKDLKEEPCDITDLKKKTFDTMEIEKEPVKTMDLQEEPVNTMDLQEEPIGTIDLKEEPVDTIDLKEEPFDIMDLKETPFVTMQIEKEPVNTMDLQDEPVDTIHLKEEPVDTIDLKEEPFDIMDLKE